MRVDPRDTHPLALVLFTPANHFQLVLRLSALTSGRSCGTQAPRTPREWHGAFGSRDPVVAPEVMHSDTVAPQADTTNIQLAGPNASVFLQRSLAIDLKRYLLPAILFKPVAASDTPMHELHLYMIVH